MSLGAVLKSYERCVTHNASYLIMMLHSSLKREPKQSITLRRLEMCLKSRVGKLASY